MELIDDNKTIKENRIDLLTLKYDLNRKKERGLFVCKHCGKEYRQHDIRDGKCTNPNPQGAR